MLRNRASTEASERVTHGAHFESERHPPGLLGKAPLLRALSREHASIGLWQGQECRFRRAWNREVGGADEQCADGQDGTDALERRAVSGSGPSLDS
jgi:hypothetical protein